MNYLTDVTRKRFSFISKAPSLAAGGGASEDGTFAVVSFKGTEAISKPYEFDIMLVTDNAEIDLSEMLQFPAVFLIHREEGDDVEYNGILAEFEQLQEFGGYVFYRARLVPKLWWLSLTHHNQVCLDQTVPEIVANTLKDGGLTTLDFEFKTRKTYDPIDYVCQYGESHFNFISRWLEKEGIYYYFEQTPNGEKIIFTDTNIAHVDFPQEANLLYRPPSGLDTFHQAETIKNFTCRQHQLPKKVLLKDYNYKTPLLSVEGRADVDPVHGRGEAYLYGEFFSTSEEGDRLAAIRAEELLCRKVIFLGDSTVPFVEPGYTFDLKEHYRENFNQKYLVTEATHEGSQTGYLISGIKEALSDREEQISYINSFTVIPAIMQFRPVRKAQTPRISGTLHAKVDASGSGEYAELDDQGRYKIALPFDINDAHSDGKASSFVRMLQPYAGDGMGMHFPLHKGTEILLTFIDGHPDRPVIAGAIPNPGTSSPVNAGNQTMAMLQTGGQNKIAIEDQAGTERILMQTPTAKTWIRMGAPNDPCADCAGAGEIDCTSTGCTGGYLDCANTSCDGGRIGCTNTSCVGGHVECIAPGCVKGRIDCTAGCDGGHINCTNTSCDGGRIDCANTNCDGGHINCSDCSGAGDINCNDCSGAGGTTCSSCNGSGNVKGKTCGKCNGSGAINCDTCGGKGKTACQTCQGKGDTICTTCDGSGDSACTDCSGKGDTICTTCDGSGDKACVTCGGKGDTICTTCDGSGDSTCVTCSGSGGSKCPDCDEHGHNPCGTCGGTGETAAAASPKPLISPRDGFALRTEGDYFKFVGINADNTVLGLTENFLLGGSGSFVCPFQGEFIIGLNTSFVMGTNHQKVFGIYPDDAGKGKKGFTILDPVTRWKLLPHGLDVSTLNGTSISQTTGRTYEELIGDSIVYNHGDSFVIDKNDIKIEQCEDFDQHAKDYAIITGGRQVEIGAGFLTESVKDSDAINDKLAEYGGNPVKIVENKKTKAILDKVLKRDYLTMRDEKPDAQSDPDKMRDGCNRILLFNDIPPAQDKITNLREVVTSTSLAATAATDALTGNLDPTKTADLTDTKDLAVLEATAAKTKLARALKGYIKIETTDEGYILQGIPEGNDEFFVSQRIDKDKIELCYKDAPKILIDKKNSAVDIVLSDTLKIGLSGSDITLTGDVKITGALEVTGAADLKSTLKVTGASTLSGGGTGKEVSQL